MNKQIYQQNKNEMINEQKLKRKKKRQEYKKCLSAESRQIIFATGSVQTSARVVLNLQ